MQVNVKNARLAIGVSQAVKVCTGNGLRVIIKSPRDGVCCPRGRFFVVALFAGENLSVREDCE